MDINEFRRISMNLGGYRRISMNLGGFRRIRVDTEADINDFRRIQED